MKMLMLLFLVLTACGQNEDGKDNDSKDETQSVTPSPETSPDELESLSLDTKDELPNCTDKNKTQLAYIISEETFYVCRASWEKISIKGAKGDKGDPGQTSNSANTWIDPATGLTWLLGGEANWATGNNACNAPYRLPSEAEGVAAGLHGIRAIAQALGLSKDFWENQVGIYIGLDGQGAIAALPTSSSYLKSVFCVR